MSAFPFIGGSLSVLLDSIFTAPLEKRKLEWEENLTDVITDLQDRVEGLTPEKLSKDQAFVTVVFQASQIAIRNHQKEKIDALRGAIFNSVLPNAPEENQQLIYLRLIDQLTPWHLRVLTFLNNPNEWMKKNGIQKFNRSKGSASSALGLCFSELKNQDALCDLIINNLQSEGLVGPVDHLHAMVTSTGTSGSLTSSIGKNISWLHYQTGIIQANLCQCQSKIAGF